MFNYFKKNQHSNFDENYLERNQEKILKGARDVEIKNFCCTIFSFIKFILVKFNSFVCR